MFEEKAVVPKGKYSLGKILEIHKMTWPFVSTLCLLTSPCYTNIRMALMTGFFSAYGVLWVLKSHTFYDIPFYYNPKYYYNFVGAIFSYASISVYYLFPYIASNNCNEITPFDVYISSALFTIGGFLHYAGDAQKFYTLKYRPGKLITEDLYSKIRHPNYTGEFLMWTSLVIISGKDNILSYIPLLWLFIITICVGAPQKQASLKKYDEYDSWEKSTYNLIPFVY